MRMPPMGTTAGLIYMRIEAKNDSRPVKTQAEGGRRVLCMPAPRPHLVPCTRAASTRRSPETLARGARRLDGPVVYETMSVKRYDCEQLGALLAQTMTAFAVTWGLHVYMGVGARYTGVPPLLMQTVMQPLTLAEHPLCRIHMRGASDGSERCRRPFKARRPAHGRGGASAASCSTAGGGGAEAQKPGAASRRTSARSCSSGCRPSWRGSPQRGRRSSPRRTRRKLPPPRGRRRGDRNRSPDEVVVLVEVGLVAAARTPPLVAVPPRRPATGTPLRWQ